MVWSVQKDPRGPDWPLGFIEVVTPGTRVSIMSLVDPNFVNSPSAPLPAAGRSIPAGALEYQIGAQQLMFQGFKPNTHGMVNNTGNVYVIRIPNGGSGDRDDYGDIVMVLSAGQTIFLAAAPLNMNAYSPYRYYLDADNAGDGALVTLFIG